MKSLQRRILVRIQRGQNWLDQAKTEFEHNRPRAGERKLELALAELRLAREKSEFWGWQEPRQKKRILPLVAGLCCAFLLVGGLFVFYTGNGDYPQQVTGEIAVERKLSLPRDYALQRREPRILEESQLNSFASYGLERELENLIIPTDL